MLRDPIQDYRELARRQVLKEFPEMRNEVEMGRMQQMRRAGR